MVMPVLAIAMLFLIGLGYTLMTKQNAVVGARAAVYYRASLDGRPQVDMNQLVEDAVSPGRERWTLTAYEGGRTRDSEFQRDGSIDVPSLGAGGIIRSAIGKLYDMLNSEIGYTASGTASLGFLPRIMKLGEAQGIYYLPHRTWTCEQSGGSYARMAMNGVRLPSVVSQFLDTSCCDCYPATR